MSPTDYIQMSSAGDIWMSPTDDIGFNVQNIIHIGLSKATPLPIHVPSPLQFA
jgi:hypothetical protein